MDEELKVYRLTASIKFAGSKAAIVRGLAVTEKDSDIRTLKKKAREKIEAAHEGDPEGFAVDIKEMKRERFDFFLAL